MTDAGQRIMTGPDDMIVFFFKITFSCVEAILAPTWGGSTAGVAAALRPPL